MLTLHIIDIFIYFFSNCNKLLGIESQLINSRKRVIRVNSTEDDVHLVVREKAIGRENKSTQNIQNKSIQATEWRKREAWSAEQADLRTKPTQWKFNKRHYGSKPASTPGDLRQDFVQQTNDYKCNDVSQAARRRYITISLTYFFKKVLGI